MHQDIKIWCELTNLPKTKRAFAIHLSLAGRARTASSELSVANLKKETGVDILIAKLDATFLPNKGRQQFSVFNELYNLRRK